MTCVFGKVTQTFWSDNEYTLQRKYKLDATEIYSMKDVFLSSALKDIEVDSVLGRGSYGVVYGAKRNGEDISLKVAFEDDDSYFVCQDAYKNYREINKRAEIPFLINMEEPIQIEIPKTTVIRKTYDQFHHATGNTKMDIPQRFICIMVMDQGTVATEPFFEPGTDKHKNTELIVDYFIKLLKSFGSLNFNANFFHGDVKPANLLFVKVRDPVKLKIVYEPRLIDFDLSFLRDATHKGPKFLVYTQTYRPPELENMVSGIDFSDDKITRNREKRQYFSYVFDEKYREEAWVVGKTIKKIIDNNNLQLESTNDHLEIIKEIADKMMAKTLEDRMTTSQAYYYAKEHIWGIKSLI